MTGTERIIDQLRRIRNLMENAGTEGEAAAAAAAMQRLLSKHNLDLQDVPVGEENDELNEPVDTEEIKTQEKQSDYKWRENLLTAIASTNFCRILHTDRWDMKAHQKRAHIIVIGQPHNREVVRFLYEVISEALIRLSKQVPMISEERKRELELAKLMGIKPRYTFSPRRSFLYGAVEVIEQRLREEWVMFQQPEGKPNDKAIALVRNSRAQIDLYVRSRWPKLGMHRPQEDGRATLDRDGYAAGREAGRSLPLQRGIGGGSQGIATKSLGEGKR